VEPLRVWRPYVDRGRGSRSLSEPRGNGREKQSGVNESQASHPEKLELSFSFFHPLIDLFRRILYFFASLVLQVSCNRMIEFRVV